eukprot:scaffold18549_cov50-Phaeocystis_antarctica.AAC.3
MSLWASGDTLQVAGWVVGAPGLGSGRRRHVLRHHLHHPFSYSVADGSSAASGCCSTASYAVYLPCCVPPARASGACRRPAPAWAEDHWASSEGTMSAALST